MYNFESHVYIFFGSNFFCEEASGWGPKAPSNCKARGFNLHYYLRRGLRRLIVSCNEYSKIHQTHSLYFHQYL